MGAPATNDWARPKALLFSSDGTVAPGDAADDRAFGERERASPIGVDCHVVPQHGANIFEVTFFVGHRDHLPVAVSRGNFGYEDRGGLLSRGVARRDRRKGHNAHECRNRNQQDSDSSHGTTFITLE